MFLGVLVFFGVLLCFIMFLGVLGVFWGLFRGCFVGVFECFGVFLSVFGCFGGVLGRFRVFWGVF